jgi:LysR family transcriptional regulator, hypochlorite-specific transcription factor HypT
MKVEFVWLEDFLALATTGNFSRAAEERHSSQPAFSRRIRALEEWIGAPLVDRSTQPAQLTEVGKWFRGVAEDLVARTTRLPGDARLVAEAASTTLRMASTHALSFTVLPRWLRSLEATLTLGSVEIASDVLSRCEGQVQEGKVHFVLAHAHPKAPGALDTDTYLWIPVGSDQLLPLSKPDRQGRPIHQLANSATDEMTPVLAYTEGSGMGRILRSVLGRRLEALPTRVVFSAHLASVLRSMTLDGRGVAWLPRTLVQDDLLSGALVPAAGAEWSIDLEIRLYRRRELAGAAAEAFWEAASAGCLH